MNSRFFFNRSNYDANDSWRGTDPPRDPISDVHNLTKQEEEEIFMEGSAFAEGSGRSVEDVEVSTPPSRPVLKVVDSIPAGLKKDRNKRNMLARDYNDSGEEDAYPSEPYEYSRRRSTRNVRQSENICTSLKAITRLVIGIIRIKKCTSHKYISRKLIQLEERASNCAVTRAQEECIKRRVYDVLNALEPMNIIRKNGKLIFPSDLEQTIERDQLQQEMEMGMLELSKKSLSLAAMKARLQAVRKLVARNKLQGQREQKNMQKLDLINISLVPDKDNSNPVPTSEADVRRILNREESKSKYLNTADFAVLMDMCDLFEGSKARKP